MKPNIINFHGQPLITIEKQREYYVAMKPIVEAIGLQWEAQYKRILRDEVLSTCMSIMTIRVPNDTQRREMVFLPLSMLNGWLFGIDANRVKPEIRPLIIEYRRECFKALHYHFTRKERIAKAFPEKVKDLTEKESISRNQATIHAKGLNARKQQKHEIEAEWQKLERLEAESKPMLSGEAVK